MVRSTIGSVDPVETVADDVTVTLMLAMERLSPVEREAVLLHDVFEVPLKDVAVTLDREPAAVRQLASRARRNIKSERTRYSLDAAEADRIARAFFEAALGGDTAALARLLAHDVEIHADGGEGVGFPQHRARHRQRPAKRFDDWPSSTIPILSSRFWREKLSEGSDDDSCSTLIYIIS